MHCCGHSPSRREWMWSTLLTTAAAVIAGCASAGRPEESAVSDDDPLAAALRLLRENASVDVHTHAGPFGITSNSRPSGSIARTMRSGRIAVLCLSDVPDGPILGRDASGVLRALRQPEPGALYRYHLDRLDWTDDLCAYSGVRRVLTVADVKAAHRAGAPAVIMDIEGLDFLEGKLERLEESYRRGVRTMQLVHYTPNDIGDFQTGAVVHNGLTPFGADVIRACHRLGVVVDVAHATEPAVKQAVRVASKPLLLSHTALRGSRAQGETPLVERQITPDHARAIAESGGSIGIWHFFATPELYADGLKEMVDVVGVDHVSIGTDMASSAGLFQDYDRYPRLVDAMLRGGFTPADTAKIIGGNYLRVLAASAG
ncbi:MAG TPA: membrane dipeptidase [Candidatus Bathyarchaeia archaeon]|nr:membrane dipeptidase [Candidatus Bathyarchaeia archaeon]